ncbi:bifunctional metallophosphatase/5'-nucleotidase [Usitatibacter palustris]|uniref:Endonuclease YhcR n=1 Tax=Usitatibacter palustris TaxID=2732487 RepID=A0A6M4H6M9_9PROT|nr:bifunctional UDP-sugar hydrolase/5'-nucleotidase [Usitatibacter palustris]QJR15289.1 Endonuclease YhcR [Usitatibacter palustris]
MKTIRITTLAAALSFGVFTAFAAQLDPVPVRLIGINDFHGHLEAGNNLLFLQDPTAAKGSPEIRVNAGGAANLAGLVRSLRAGAPYSFMLAGGDLIGASPLPSTLFKHETTIEILGEIGLDASTVGNHEFDAGMPELQRIIKGGCAPTKPDDIVVSCGTSPYAGAKFKYLGANVVDAKGNYPIAPYLIKEFDGIKVGFIGAVTKTTPQMVLPSGIVGLTFQDEADAVNRAADELRAKGVRAMVAVFHEGIELGTQANRGEWNDTTCPNAHGPLLGIAQRLAPEIRVIFSGHTHQGYRCEIGGRLLIQGTSYGRGISVVDVELDRSTRAMLPPVRSYNLPVLNERTEAAQREKLVAATPAPFNAVLRDAKPDAAIAAKVAQYVTAVAPKANRPVGRVTAPIIRSFENDSAAGRLIADAQLAATKALGSLAAFMNPGGVRANFECTSPPCTVTFGQSFTMQPFGNSLVVMSLTGAQLKAMLESQKPGASGEPRFLQPSEGFTYTWTDNAAPGTRVSDMRFAGQPVESERKYRVTVNSFLAEGGDGFAAIKDGTEQLGGGQDLDALLAWLGAGDRSPPPNTRINRVK